MEPEKYVVESFWPSIVNESVLDKIKQFNTSHPGHEQLFENIKKGMTEAEVIGQLIDNFFERSDFNYNFSSIAPFSHKGDCGTLVREFITIGSECFGIKMESEGGKRGYFISGGGRIVHNELMTGNIDNGGHWYFESHVWAMWDGKPIDVLFGQLGVVGHLAGVEVTYENKMPIWKAGDTTFYLKRGARTRSEQYTTNPDEKM